MVEQQGVVGEPEENDADVEVTTPPDDQPDDTPDPDDDTPPETDEDQAEVSPKDAPVPE